MRTTLGFLLVLLFSLTSFSCSLLEGTRLSSDSPKTTIYVVRHAEKELGSAPGLTPQGSARAEFYAKFFAKEKLSAVYSTPTRRTIATATPVAKAQKISVEEYANGLDFDALAVTLLAEHEGETIFIVGHSNTVPLILNALSKTEDHTDVPHEEYRRLYQVILDAEHNADVRMWEVPVEVEVEVKD
ncbi:MAG: histidine phosphatase family protein [Saprospiraceae bacterium]